MYDFVILLSLVVFVFLIIGFFNPNKSLFWFKGERTKKKSFIIYFISFFVLGILSEITKPQSVIDEENKRKEELVQQEKEEELNKVHRIDDCNDFKDNTMNYKGKIIEDKFYYGNNGQTLRSLVETFKNLSDEKFIPVNLYHYDNDRNRCDITVQLPIELKVPNVMSGGEKVIINFTCFEGDLNNGNIVNSIVRPEN